MQSNNERKENMRVQMSTVNKGCMKCFGRWSVSICLKWNIVNWRQDCDMKTLVYLRGKTDFLKKGHIKDACKKREQMLRWRVYW